MDLNRDNKDIYTIDRDQYAEYMKEDRDKPSILTVTINMLLLVLFLVLAYFFYTIVKKDLSFSDVFNKQEWDSTYAFFSDKEVIIEEKLPYVEILAQAITVVKEKPQETVVLSVFKIREEVSPILEVEKVLKDEVVSKVEESKVDRISSEYLELISKELSLI